MKIDYMNLGIPKFHKNIRDWLGLILMDREMAEEAFPCDIIGLPNLSLTKYTATYVGRINGSRKSHLY